MLYRRLLSSSALAVAAGLFAKSLGVPLWTTWVAGDVFDITLLVFLGIFILTGLFLPTVAVPTKPE